MMNKKWMGYYNLAKNYYLEHGDLDIPTKYKIKIGDEVINLGSWIHNQRKGYKGINTVKLDENQIKLLESIGMDWVSPKNNMRKTCLQKWMKNYNLAKEYYLKYGDLDIPFRYKIKNGEEEINLGLWIKAQKQNYKGHTKSSLSENQIKLLNTIGIVWKLNVSWNEYYNLAKEYYRKHGNLLVPTYHLVNHNGRNINLGIWIHNQRQAYKGHVGYQITDDQIKKLNEIGMVWEVINRNQFYERYDEALKYFNKYGNLNVKQNYITENGEKLGVWLNDQRMAYKCNSRYRITDKKIELLDKLNVRWFTKGLDIRLQKEIITDENKIRKHNEIHNRVITCLNNYELDTLSKEEINKRMIKQLN